MRNFVVLCALLLLWIGGAVIIRVENLRGGAVIGLLAIGVFITLGGIHYFVGPSRSQNLTEMEVSDE